MVPVLVVIFVLFLCSNFNIFPPLKVSYEAQIDYNLNPKKVKIRYTVYLNILNKIINMEYRQAYPNASCSEANITCKLLDIEILKTL